MINDLSPSAQKVQQALQAMGFELQVVELPDSTRTAAEALGTPVGTGSSSGQAARTLLFDTVIELLNVRAAQ